EHDHDLVDAGARQRHELAHDQRHAAELEQRFRAATEALAGPGAEQNGADRRAGVEAIGFEQTSHRLLLVYCNACITAASTTRRCARQPAAANRSTCGNAACMPALTGA